MAKEDTNQQKSRQARMPEFPLSFFACPNPDCADFNRFAAGNLSIAERMGKDKAIRRLYCKTCGTRFSEREGSLMEDTKLPEEVVVRIIKCLGHGCSIEATADICEVDQRTVERYLQKGGRRAEDFHRLQSERLQEAKCKSAERLADKVASVQLDELHGRVAKSDRGWLTPESKKGAKRLLDRIVERVGRGFIRRWR
jgi:transposase-like protein